MRGSGFVFFVVGIVLVGLLVVEFGFWEDNSIRGFGFVFRLSLRVCVWKVFG